MSTKSAHFKSIWLEDNFFKKCRKRNCTGTQIYCEVTYKPGGRTHFETECSDCGNVVKDPRYSFKHRKMYEQKSPVDTRPNKYRTNQRDR